MSVDNPEITCATCDYYRVPGRPCVHPDEEQDGFWDRPQEECWKKAEVKLL